MTPPDRQEVQVYFDFVSPYTYLALTRLPELGRRHGIRWRSRPVVYAALLDATGLVGPVETEAKRRYSFVDVLRSAERIGVPLAGPPAHPFRSLEALRAVVWAQGRGVDEDEELRLVVGLATACWGAGEDLTDLGVIAEVLEEVGIDTTAAELGAALTEPSVKRRLHRFTDEALEAGVFGVPTFVWRDELFWGHDRLDDLMARIRGDLPDVRERAGGLIGRPRGADRKR